MRIKESTQLKLFGIVIMGEAVVGFFMGPHMSLNYAMMGFLGSLGIIVFNLGRHSYGSN